MEIVVVFLMGISNHVEISKKHPRGGSDRGDGSKLIKERWPKFRCRRSINVSDNHRKVRGGGSEVGGESVRRAGGVGRTEDRAVPSSKDATGTSIRWIVNEAIKATREEGTKFKRGDGWQLSFLEQDDIGTCRQEFRQHIATLN
jgi:hypothetical protein